MAKCESVSLLGMCVCMLGDVFAGASSYINVPFSHSINDNLEPTMKEVARHGLQEEYKESMFG